MMNGSCVTMIVKISAGSSGPRRFQRSRWSETDFWPRRVSVTGGGAVGALRTSSVLVAVVRDGLGLRLRGLQGGVGRLMPGQHGGELLRDLGPEVLELGNPDVLDALVGDRQLARMVGVGGLERGERGLRRSGAGLDVLRQRIGREAAA